MTLTDGYLNLHSNMDRLKPAAKIFSASLEIFTFQYGQIKTRAGSAADHRQINLHSNMDRLKPAKADARCLQ